MKNPLFKRFSNACDGIAMVEFAAVTPFLLLMALGGVELTNYVLAHMRVNQIAVTVADNAGRIPVAVDEANIHEVFAGANVLGRKLDFKQNGRVVLSSLQENKGTGSAKGQMIGWQRCWGELAVKPAYGEENAGSNNSSLRNGLGSGDNKIKAVNDMTVMFVEVTYSYQPIIGAFWSPKGRIRHESAFNVRSRKNQQISNANSIYVMDCD